MHTTAGERGGYILKSSLPLPPALCYREFTSAQSQQPDSNRESLVSERDLLTTKLQAILRVFCSGQKLALESFQLLFLWVSVIGLLVVCLRPATLLRKRIWHRCFSLNFCETFKNTFFVGHLRANVSGNNITVFVFLISRMKASMRHLQTVRFLSSVY